MAKIKFNQDFENGLSDFTDLSLKVKQKGALAVWTDTETGAKIELHGKNFERSADNEDFLSAGKIESAEITDGDGKLFVSITGLNIKATKLMAAYDQGGTQAVAFFVTKDDDIVKGSKHSEVIVGGGGDDVMTGGKGADMFYFHYQELSAAKKVAPEHDIITDFDWKGDDADSLQNGGEFHAKGVHQGKDTLITYEVDGSTLLLEGVTKQHFDFWLDHLPS